MNIKKGRNRIVIITDKLAVKFPRIYFLKAFRGMVKYGRKKELIFWLRIPYHCHIDCFQRFLFKGVIDNLQEFFFSYIHPSKLPLPTLLSFFGFVSIQKRGRIPLPNNTEIDEQLELLAKGDPRIAVHAFSDRNNLCLVNGHLRIIDYGSPEPRQVIAEHGDNIWRNFDVFMT